MWTPSSHVVGLSIRFSLICTSRVLSGHARELQCLSKHFWSHPSFHVRCSHLRLHIQSQSHPARGQRLPVQTMSSPQPHQFHNSRQKKPLPDRGSNSKGLKASHTMQRHPFWQCPVAMLGSQTPRPNTRRRQCPRAMQPNQPQCEFLAMFGWDCLSGVRKDSNRAWSTTHLDPKPRRPAGTVTESTICTWDLLSFFLLISLLSRFLLPPFPVPPNSKPVSTKLTSPTSYSTTLA